MRCSCSHTETKGLALRYFKQGLFIGAVLLMGQTATAHAADFDPYKSYKPYKPSVETVKAPVARESTVYLRGFIGMTNQDIDGFTNEAIARGNFSIVQHDFDSSPLVGLGIGAQVGHRFRVDFTGEYRGASSFRGLDTFSNCAFGPGICTNEHTGTKEEWLFLANGYWDIATFRGITPYVGAGVGFAVVTLDNFWDVNLLANGLSFADSNTETNFAWALHAGFAYDVTDALKLDVAYRYVDTGDGITGGYTSFDGQTFGATTLENIHSHDVMVGLRWNIGHEGEEHHVAYK